MGRSSSNRKPAFFWQALLIVLPVIVLAVVGFVSIRQDKLLAQHEAADRAQTIADDLLPRLWAELMATNLPHASEYHAFRVDKAGQLLFPPLVADLPVPIPFDLAQLNPAQRKLWETAQASESDDRTRTAAMQAYRDFLDSTPPENFAATAEYALGLLLTKATGTDVQPKGGSTLIGRNPSVNEAAFESFARVIESYPNAIGDSGLPLRPLAQLKLLELTSFGRGYADLTNRHRYSSRSYSRPQNYISAKVLYTISHTNSAAPTPVVSFDSFCSNLVYYPSPLSAFLLNEVVERPDPKLATMDDYHGHFQRTNLIWLDLWQAHEADRDFYASAKAELTPTAPRLFWFNKRGDDIEQQPENPASLSSSNKPSDHWLAVRSDETPTSHWFLCRSQREVTSRLSPFLQTKRIPDYLGVVIEVAGRRLTSEIQPWHEVNYHAKAGGIKKEFLREFPVSILATNSPRPSILGSAVQSEGGADLMRVNVYLTGPDALFKRQRTRTFWFGSLIAVSALAAFVGLLAAWQAFYSQQRLSEMKSNFVSSVSHELRAPIASVRLLAESLELGKIKEPQKQVEYFRFIGQECRRLSGLIQNVLDFSRIEQGRKQYDFEPTDLLALAEETVNLMQTYAVEKEVSLKLDLTKVQPSTRNLELCVDSRAIQQALINLIDNAIKHSPKGGEVRVGIDRLENMRTSSPQPSPPREEREGAVRVWVEDHGPGISQAEHERIFERFYRVGSELRRETQGVGIGLSIVKHVVEAHGGWVRVESVVGKGSRFTMELPMENPKSE
jgi:signal transduction histidine kinase